MNKIIAPILLLVLAVAASGCTSTSDTGASTQSDIKVEELQIVPEGYGFYSIKGKITPLKDFDYLEIVLKWYDSDGNIIQTDPLAWNINNAKASQSIKFSTSSYIDAGTPAKVDLMIFDDPFSGGDESSAIYKTTLNI